MSIIPQELKERTQWVLHKQKVPYQVNGRKASVTKPRTWASYKAIEGYQDIGFVFTKDDPFVGIDLDNCIDEQWAKQIVSLFNSYTEITPSGKGYHIWVKGKWNNSSNRVSQIEVYNQERFFTFTSNHVASTPATVEYRQEQLDLFSIIMRLCENDKAKKLWQGDFADYSSASEADLALCSYIARHTHNKDIILGIVQHSGLWDQKWQRLDYQERTIDAALQGKYIAISLRGHLNTEFRYLLY
jgi:putative DNA primase/helicase